MDAHMTIKCTVNLTQVSLYHGGHVRYICGIFQFQIWWDIWSCTWQELAYILSNTINLVLNENLVADENTQKYTLQISNGFQ